MSLPKSEWDLRQEHFASADLKEYVAWLIC